MHKNELNQPERQWIIQRLLLIEAMIYLLLARLLIICLPFNCLAWLMSRKTRQPELKGDRRKFLIRLVRWSILHASHVLPFKIVCFPRGFAAQAMLRRRGITTTVYYGAASRSGRGLVTHVWVQDGAEGVMGLRAATGYKVIAKYPGSLL